MGDALKQKMISAVTWSTIEKTGQQLLQFLAGIIFARLLVPEDFGIMGIVMIFVAVSMILVESGFGQALIRKEKIGNDDYTTVFYFNLVTALLLYVLLFATAPLIAEYFHQQYLISIIRVMSIAVVINAFYLIPYAQLGRALDFKLISKVNISSTTGGVIAGVVAAFAGAGVWALVAQQSVYHLLRMMIMHSVVKWKPTGQFRFGIIRGLWDYSLKILFTSLTNILFNNLFIIILGRSYSRAEAGQFAQGNKLSETFNFTFQSIFAGSTFALFSQVQSDIARMGRILGELIKRTALITIPVISVLIAAASPLITLIWTDKFQPAVIYFQLVSLASILTPFYVMNLNALNARGKSGKTMAIELIKKALIVICIFVLYQYGIVYMLAAYLIGSLLAYPVSVWFIRKELQQPVLRQLSNLVPGITTGLILGGIAGFINQLQLSVLATLTLQFSSVSILYLLIVRLFYRSLFDKAIGYIRTAHPFKKSTGI
jgi:O-antigen/teichoic acid export membrane protein